MITVAGVRSIYGGLAGVGEVGDLVEEPPMDNGGVGVSSGDVLNVIRDVARAGGDIGAAIVRVINANDPTGYYYTPGYDRPRRTAGFMPDMSGTSWLLLGAVALGAVVLSRRKG